MDHHRFDALTRAVATPRSRRTMLRRAVVGATAVLLGGPIAASKTASAHHCTYEGCGCSTGTRHACGRGLVCCASSPGTPGGAGVCTPHGQCGPSCIEHGNACPGHCNWSGGCAECCSGYCGQFGACDQTSGEGSSCAAGTANSCASGLVCCSFVPGLVGGAGTCQYRC